MHNEEEISYNVAYYNQQCENYRRRLENVRVLYTFWFTTLGGIAYFAFNQLMNSKMLEGAIVLFVGSLMSFVIGNMIMKNQFHINLLKRYIEASVIYKACDNQDAHITHKIPHVRESVLDVILAWVIPILIFCGSVVVLVLWLVQN